MNGRLSIFKVLLIFVLGILLSPAASSADEFNVEPTNQEIIDEVAKKTGLYTDTVKSLYEDSPKLFDKVTDTMTAVKVVDLLFSAKDSEALAEVYNWQVGKLVDKFIEKTYPPSFVFFVSSVKLYQSSLEAIRDYIFIPSMEATIYERYKSHRGGRYDYSISTPDDAYTLATLSKYYPAKKKMYGELVKARGYNPDVIGKKLESSLWKEIDDFWIKRLESTYQKELLTRDREKIIEDAWAKVASDLKVIKAAAGKSKDIESFFVKVPNQLPEGWWHVTASHKSNHIPKQIDPKKKRWMQSFRISRDQGYEKIKNLWKNPKDLKRRLTYSSLITRVNPSDEATSRKTMDKFVKDSGFKYMADSKLAIIKTEKNERSHKVEVMFYRLGFKVTMSLQGLSDKNSSPSEATIKYFARAMAGNMDGSKK